LLHCRDAAHVAPPISICYGNRAIFAGRRAPEIVKSRLDSKGLRRPPATAPSLRMQSPKNERITVAGEVPIVSGMAGRYASALFELARDAKTVDTVKADLERFDALVAANPDLLRLVRSPVFGAEEQARALAAVLERAGIKGLTANFLLTVASNRRLFAVRDMVKAFRTLVARHKGEVSANVIVAEKLSEKHLDALKTALKSVTGGKSVDLDVKIDPAIIGGLVVKLGSRMVDTSLRTKLNAIKNAMKEAG
jgi:F-type H+-transporting ATPase subunit delta